MTTLTQHPMSSVHITLSERHTQVRRTLGTSLILHLTILVAFTVKTFFFSTEPVIYESALRVDLVAMPDKIETQLKEPLKTHVPLPDKTMKKPKEEKRPEIVLKPEKTPSLDLKNKQAEALRRLKAIQSIEDLVEKERQADKKREEYKGNFVSPGTALRGLNKIQYDTYISELDAQVKKNWLLPEWLAHTQLKARVLVIIDQRGSVVRKSLLQSSKHQIYDRLVMEAIDRAAPFPAPPEKFINLVGEEGIVFGFPE